MSKKIIAIILGVLAAFSFAGFVACNNTETIRINTYNPNVTYYVGDNVYMFDLFEMVDEAKYEFTVTYNDKTQNVEGTSVYLGEAGEYSFNCKMSVDNKVDDENKIITVYEKKAFLILGTPEIDLDLNRVMISRAVIALGAPVVISDSDHDEYVSQVEIFDKDDGGGRTVEIIDGEPTSDGFWDGTKFHFIYECKHVFTVVSETGGGKVSADLIINVKENFSAIPETDGTISYDDKTKTVEWNEISGAESYRVKIDLKSAVVQKNTTGKYSLSIKPYLNANAQFQYFDLRILARDSAGKEFAQMIYEDVVIAPEGSEGLVVGSGASVDPVNHTIRLAGKDAFTGAASDIAKMNNSHIAFAGKFGIGTYVDFTFKGNNLPNVMFFADEINGNMTNEGGLGFMLVNGMFLRNKGVSKSPTAVSGEDRIVCIGPDRLHKGGGQSDPFHNYIACGEIYSKDYTVSENSLFTQKALREDSSARTYRYTVGSFDCNGKLAFELRLYDADTNELIELASYTTKVLSSEVKSGHIVAYATIKGAGIDTEFGYGLPYSGTPHDKTINWKGVIENPDGSVTISGSKFVGAGYTSQFTDSLGESVSYNSANYLGISESYDVGTYIDITFSGNNMPSIMLFADKINGDLSSFGGKGLLIVSGVNCSGNLRGYDRLAVYGMNRIPAAYDANGNLKNDYPEADYVSAKFGYVYGDSDAKTTITTLSKTNYPFLTTNGLIADDSGRTYKLTVGTFANINGKVVIDIMLFDALSGVKIYDVQVETSNLLSEVIAGSIVLYGKIQGESEDTTFRYSMPYAGVTDPIKATSNGATKNADGSVTLAGKKLSGAPYATNVTKFTNSFLGLIGDYGIGTEIEIKFVGENMPNVMIFADNVNGNMTSDGGSGILFAGSVYNGSVNYDNGLWIHGMTRIYNSGTQEGTHTWKDNNTSLLGFRAGTNYPYLTRACLATDETGREYTYTISTKLSAGGNIVLLIKMTAEANGTLDAINYDIKYETSFTEDDIKGTNIVIYGAVKGESNNTTFNYSVKKANA